VPTWRLTYRPGAWPRAPLVVDVDADEHEEHEWYHEFWRNTLVVDRPRRVIELRVDRRDLAVRPFRVCHVRAVGRCPA
jgi:hypothetical protein